MRRQGVPSGEHTQLTCNGEKILQVEPEEHAVRPFPPILCSELSSASGLSSPGRQRAKLARPRKPRQAAGRVDAPDGGRRNSAPNPRRQHSSIDLPPRRGPAQSICSTRWTLGRFRLCVRELTIQNWKRSQTDRLRRRVAVIFDFETQDFLSRLGVVFQVGKRGVGEASCRTRLCLRALQGAAGSRCRGLLQNIVETKSLAGARCLPVVRRNSPVTMEAQTMQVVEDGGAGEGDARRSDMHRVEKSGGVWQQYFSNLRRDGVERGGILQVAQQAAGIPGGGRVPNVPVGSDQQEMPPGGPPVACAPSPRDQSASAEGYEDDGDETNSVCTTTTTTETNTPRLEIPTASQTATAAGKMKAAPPHRRARRAGKWTTALLQAMDAFVSRMDVSEEAGGNMPSW